MLKGFFQILFSHNNISILGESEGKEKQDHLEYYVSKVTALWLYEGPPKPQPGGSACHVTGEPPE